MEEYAMKIEALFYLIENERLTNKERNDKLINILSELHKNSMRIGHRKGVAICKNALNGLENASNSTY